MKKITSLTNPLIKHVISLHDSHNRKKFQECIVEGIRAITTFVQAKKLLKTLYITEEWLLESHFCSPDKIAVISETLMKKISTAVNPSGILAVFSISPNIFVSDLENPPLVLAQIQDPGNMGTLIRSAAAFNKKNIIVVESVDPWNPKVIQASAGTIALVSLFHMHWHDVVILKNTFKLAALVSKDGKVPSAFDYKKTILIIGNEAQGLPLDWQKECDLQITLPMPGGTESLNAAVAGSIMLYLSIQKH
jgi:RNA methyltransferase, TrmH family